MARKAIPIKRKAGRMPIRARRRPAKKPAPNRGRWYADIGDLLKLKDTTHIGGLLQEQAMSVMHGEPDSFKTGIALAIASSVAYGMQIVPGGPRCKRGLTLYAAFEDPKGFKGRRLAWLRYHQLPAKNLTIDAVKVINPHGDDIDDLPGFDFDLLDPDKVTKLIEHAKELSLQARLPIRLIVIDVLRDALGGIASTKTFMLAARHVKRIYSALNCHVMLLHHNTKNSEKMLGPASLEAATQQRFLIRRAGRFAQLTVMKNREGQPGWSLMIKAHQMIMGIAKNKPPVSALAMQFEALTQEELQESHTEKLMQWCEFFEPDTYMSEAKLLIASGMSVDGRGGMQRKLLRKWVPISPNGTTIHNGGTDYRRFFREQVRKHWVYYCQAVTPETGKEELMEEAAQKKKPKVEPEVARKQAGGKRA